MTGPYEPALQGPSDQHPAERGWGGRADQAINQHGELSRDIRELRREIRDVRAQATEAIVAAKIAESTVEERVNRLRDELRSRIDDVTAALCDTA